MAKNKRKSVDVSIETDKEVKKQLYIVVEDKPISVNDFIPEYKMKYEGLEEIAEAEVMINTLEEFIKENEQLVLVDYNSGNIEAVQEGFKRAVAICSLFIRATYVDGIIANFDEDELSEE